MTDEPIFGCGHLRTSSNTAIVSGQRRCRQCRKDRNRWERNESNALLADQVRKLEQNAHAGDLIAQHMFERIMAL